MADADLPPIDAGAADALAHARHGDPFAVLGPHALPDGRRLIRSYQPGALGVEVLDAATGAVLARLDPAAPDGLFQGATADARPYRLRIAWPGGVQETEDPYAFGLVSSGFDLYLFNEGRHFDLADALGNRVTTVDGVDGVRFAVWAPNARRVSVIGDFNAWDGRRHPMRRRAEAGVWELFVPRLAPGTRYKYEILGADGHVAQKADPISTEHEKAPATASVVARPFQFAWTDGDWMARRARAQAPDAPISIYEVHLASWLDPNDVRASVWDAAVERLVPYVVEMGFSHVELLPVAEHPFGGSWGYQPLGLFAPTARFGPPEGLARFVDTLHRLGIGIIIDWVPAHFPSDAHGLVRFDGTALYEHQDPREGFHHDWNTLIYNFGRREVQGFLIASALHWLKHFHIDGLRVDAVASMLYRDYSRKAGEWIPNIHGGRENLEAVGFLKHLNAVVAEHCPGAVTIAEESTSWPGVTHPIADGGLGFTYKWNMGWMNDTLRYMAVDPLYRSYHHDDLTFGLIYAFSEKFILPLSHDEVVHGKGSLLGKMPGDEWQRFANLRAYFGFMWSHPGKKLIFMGIEIAQEGEWNHDVQIPWPLLDRPNHLGVQRLVRDLNELYRTQAALHVRDSDWRGFRWVIGDDRANSVFAYLRQGETEGEVVLAVVNMTPVPHHGYRVGVPLPGGWREILNTDSAHYGGSNLGNGGTVETQAVPLHGFGQSLGLTLPPLATVLLRPAA